MKKAEESHMTTLSQIETWERVCPSSSYAIAPSIFCRSHCCFFVHKKWSFKLSIFYPDTLRQFLSDTEISLLPLFSLETPGCLSLAASTPFIRSTDNFFERIQDWMDFLILATILNFKLKCLVSDSLINNFKYFPCHRHHVRMCACLTEWCVMSQAFHRKFELVHNI